MLCVVSEGGVCVCFVCGCVVNIVVKMEICVFSVSHVEEKWCSL